MCTTMPFATGVVHDAGVPGTAVDLDEAEPAGAERVQHIGRAELGDFGPHLHRGAHD